jgi:hypothetical protein
MADASLPENVKLAFESCSKVSTELVTVATAIITVTITFAKDIFKNAVTKFRWMLVTSWGFYLLSMIAGMATLLAVTAVLEPQKPTPNYVPSIWHHNIRLFAAAQVITFGLATLLTIIYGAISLFRKPASADNKPATANIGVKISIEAKQGEES